MTNQQRDAPIKYAREDFDSVVTIAQRAEHRANQAESERDALRLAILQELERCAKASDYLRFIRRHLPTHGTFAEDMINACESAQTIIEAIRALPDPCDLTEAREMVHRLADLEKQLASKQAKIDTLMEEYCPDEMTEEQMANWAAHQRPATPEETAAIDAAINIAQDGDA